MAPEQVLGDELTAATDVYQLGVTFYELISGELPFSRGDLSYAHMTQQIPSLLDKDLAVPEELARLIHRCMEKDPALRFSSAGELLEAMLAMWSRLTDSPLPAGPGHATGNLLGSAGRVGRKPMASPAVYALAIVLVVGIVALSVVALVLVRGQEGSDSSPAREVALVHGEPASLALDPPMPEAMAVLLTAKARVDAARIVAFRGGEVRGNEGATDEEPTLEPAPSPQPSPSTASMSRPAAVQAASEAAGVVDPQALPTLEEQAVEEEVEEEVAMPAVPAVQAQEELVQPPEPSAPSVEPEVVEEPPTASQPAPKDTRRIVPRSF
jgi:hypothetical protein